MKLVAYRSAANTDHRQRDIGVVIGESVAHLAPIDDFYDDVDRWKALAREKTQGELALGDLTLAPLAPRDAKIICMAINYRKHGAEANLPPPGFPNLFARWTSELIVDQGKIPVPQSEPDGLDWEVELAAIVGSKLTDADVETAKAGILGYTVANDVSARAAQLQAATLSTGQWALGKNPEKSAAVSSFLETSDSIDISDLTLDTIVDGEIMQSGTTADMIFSPAEIIAFASSRVTLRPGDLILTGTPDGVGLGRNPRVYMKPGATVTARITGLGSITNFIVDSSHRG